MTPGLMHQNSQVRKKACDVLFFLYRLNGEQTRYLFDELIHQDAAKELREKMIENVRDEFDRMDGKPTKKEMDQARRQEAESQRQRQQQEVEELQRKLAEAKALNRQVQLFSISVYRVFRLIGNPSTPPPV